MKYFDLHCDTATALLSRSQSLFDNNLHISLKKAETFESYAQVMAIWTHHKLSDEQGYETFFKVLHNLKNEIEINSNKTQFATDHNSLNDAWSNSKTPLILAVEDARILQNDLSKLDILYSKGVRLLTLNWYGDTCIGGAHNTNNGLTDFGVNVVKKCFELDIIPDISHSSFKGASQVIELAKSHQKPIVASHSDSYKINPHSRNLRDEDFVAISNLGGLVGINLCPDHLAKSDASVSDVVKHIDHYLSLGGINTIAMGCDLDGTNLPKGFTNISDVHKIVDELNKINYSNELIEKIMYKNALHFFKNNLLGESL